MVDDNFRPYRSRPPLEREEEADPAARGGTADPLAELARLIGQRDPYAEPGRHEGPAESADDTAASGLDWAADDTYAEEHDDADDRSAAPPAGESYSSYAPQDRGYDQQHDYEQDRNYRPEPQASDPPASNRFLSGPAAKFGGLREDVGHRPTTDESHFGEAREAVLPGRQSPSFASPASDQPYAADDRANVGSEAYDEHYEEIPRRRSGLVVVMAVLALAVVGTAGAFAYRAMFGSSVLPTLPPIIKATDGPNKIMPSYSDARASNTGQAGAASAGSTEKLVSREEQPVEIQEPAKTAPRVISTIPISPGTGSPPPGVAAPAPAASAPAASVSSWPPVVAPPPAAAPAPAPPAAPAPASVPSEPKKIHTVIIRADQPAAPAASDAAAAAPIPATRSAARPRTPPKPSITTAASAGGQPLSLVPGPQGEPAAPAPTPTRMAAARTSVASAAPAAEASAGGGYAVQVTSQRSEADAQASFRALRAKFPDQLGGREPIVRRADLGAKGVYYRALVGPFASMEEAAGMCSSLKAAGGNCIVQRN
ncbi:MAG TPA: SPOR domain-containing protein [Xanthobacteraceae bacterium]|nr:SPOR domain-containing protein [Xanthobacteraceae bacterium]